MTAPGPDIRTGAAGQLLAAEPALRLAATLGVPAPRRDGVLPPLWHWLYFLDAVPRCRLGADGHAACGPQSPAHGLPRRMWAGCRVVFHAALPFGAAARRTASPPRCAVKTGRSGRLAFVTRRHEIGLAGGAPAVSEESDVVYRAAAAPGAPPAPPPAPAGAPWRLRFTADAVLLFRFSALTFNSHRIHYDRDHARRNGYRGAVVHGPLVALLLAGLAADRGGPLTAFDCRAVSPLFEDETFTLGGRPVRGGAELWAAAPGGGLAMHATAAFAPGPETRHRTGRGGGIQVPRTAASFSGASAAWAGR